MLNLAGALEDRGSNEDINKAIGLLREALEIFKIEQTLGGKKTVDTAHLLASMLIKRNASGDKAEISELQCYKVKDYEVEELRKLTSQGGKRGKAKEDKFEDSRR